MIRRTCWASCPSRLTITILLAAATFLSSCTDPIGRYSPPICSSTGVLDYVANQYSTETERPTLVRDTALQYPAEAADTVLCAVYVRRTVYDAAKFGGLPEIVIEPRFFHVRTTANALIVTFGR